MTGGKKAQRARPHKKALRLLQRINRRHVRVAVAGTLAASTLSLQPVENALQQVRSTGELHLVGISGPGTFFQQDGHIHGLQYELAQQFANELGVKLVVDPVDNAQQVLKSIGRNKAQLALTGLTSDDPRLKRLLVSDPVLEVRQQLIQRGDEFQPTSLNDLKDRVVAVAAGSAEAANMRDTLKQVPGARLVEVRQLQAMDLLSLLDEGRVDYVAMNSQEFDALRPLFPRLRDGMSMERTDAVSWAFMKSDDQSLYRAAQEFLARKLADGTLERLAAFYSNGKAFDSYGVKSFSSDIAQRLPRFQHDFENESQVVGIDWRLLAAISYQESKWNPKAVSPTGVRGLMMLTKSTADMMGVKDREHAGQSIRGGSAYFKRIMDKVPASVPEPDRTWMALAAYNMGPGHMIAARKLTQKLGGDPNSWLEVSRNLRQLAQDNRRRGKAAPDVGQGLHYVQQVRRYYDAIALNTSAQRDGSRIAALDIDLNGSVR